jgi:hypothetical protein
LPTLHEFIASRADCVVPEKLAYQEIAHQEIERTAADSERRETGPGVDRARIRPLTLPSSPPVRLMGRAALCIVHTSATSAQFCPSEKSPPVPSPRITLKNNYYLEEIGFDPRNRAQRALTCGTARSSRAASPIRVPKCLPRSVHKDAQPKNRCHFPLPG